MVWLESELETSWSEVHYQCDFNMYATATAVQGYLNQRSVLDVVLVIRLGFRVLVTR